MSMMKFQLNSSGISFSFPADKSTPESPRAGGHNLNQVDRKISQWIIPKRTGVTQGNSKKAPRPTYLRFRAAVGVSFTCFQH